MAIFSNILKAIFALPKTKNLKCLLPFPEKCTFARWDDACREFGGDWSTLLKDCVTEEHGNDVLVVIEKTVTIDVAKVPNLSQLIFLETRVDKDVPRFGRRKESTLRTERFEILAQSIS